MAEGAFDPDAFLGTKPQAQLAPPKQVVPPTQSSFNPDAFLATKATEPSSSEMPGILDATMHGLGSAWRGLKQTATVGSTSPQTDEPSSPAAAPFELSDLTSPISRGAPKVAYRLAEGTPTLAAGVAGGILGGTVGGPVGAVAGGAGGSALGAVAQSVGPVFAEELKRTPHDPDGAWDRTVKTSAANGIFSAAGWAAFPLRIAGGPLKNMVFQAFGVQPGISVANKATTNVLTDRPLTENLGHAYTEGAVMSAVPAAGHAIVNAAIAKPKSRSMSDPDMAAVNDRIVDSPDGKKFANFDEAYTKYKDDLHPFWAAEKSMTDAAGSGALPIQESPYHLARLTRGSSGKAASFIDYETFDFNTGNRTGDSLRKVLSPAKEEIDALNTYLVAKRTLELDARGINTGVPLAEAQRIVSNPNYRGRFEPVAQQLYGYQDRLLNYLKDSGILNDEQVRTMQQANQDYVPFYRLMDPDNQRGVSSGSGLRAWNPVKGIKGSDRQIINPVESIIKNTHLMIDLAERNRAMQAFGELVARSPNGAEIARPVSGKARPIELTQQEMQRLFNSAHVPNAYGPPSNFTIFRKDAFRPGPNQVAYYKDGRRHLLETDPMIANAVKGLDNRSIGVLEKVMATPAKMLRAGVTLAPEFFVRNMARDQLAAFALSKNGYVPVYDFVKGMRSILGGKFDAWLDSRGGGNVMSSILAKMLGKGEAYKDWLKSGGANAALISGDRNYLANEIRRLSESGSFNEAKGLIRNPLNALQAVSELMESATRVGDFARARQKGKHLHEAGFDSREVTLDFWRIGAKARALNNIVAFWNAQVEGLDRTARAFKERPIPTTLKVGASVTLPSLLLWWANYGDKRMDEIPSWEKDFFWHIPTDKWTDIDERTAKNTPKHLVRQQDGKWQRNDGTIYKIPKNFEIGLLFGSVPERVLDAYANNNPDAWRNVGKSLQRAFVPPWMPQFAAPVLEHATNYSFFTERPLEPQSFTDRGGILPSDRFTPYTTDTAKIIGKGLGKITDNSISSPIILENYVRQWTGTLGMQSLRMADGVLNKSGILKSAPKPTDTAADTFFVRGFTTRYPMSNAESIQKFYDEYNKRAMAHNTAKLREKRQDSEGAAGVRESYATERAQSIYNNLSKQNKYIREVYLDPKMTPEQKRRAIDDTYFAMIEQAQEGVKIFRETKVK